MVTGESKSDRTHPFFGPVLLSTRVVRSSFPQVFGLHLTAYLQPIPKCTNEPSHKEDAQLFVLEACVGKSELQCGLCVWFVICCVCPHPDFSCSGAGCTGRVEKVNALCQPLCSSATLDAANTYSRAGWGPGDPWNRQTLNEFLRHNRVQLWQSVGRSIF